MRTIGQVCKTRLWRFYSAAGGMVWLLALEAMASAKPATKLVNVADTRLMDPGFSKWVADVYNSNLWLYGLIVVTIMATMGLVLGFGFDRVIAMVGIDLGKLDHHE